MPITCLKKSNPPQPAIDTAAAEMALTPGIKAEIRFARDRLQDVARRQRESLLGFEAERLPGLEVGQRLILCNTAGCCVPGGRDAHAASAITSVGTTQVAGVRHSVATSPATRDSGGLSVGKFIKTVAWQRLTRDASRTVGMVAALISRLEGMEGHTRTGDVRLHRYYPQDPFDLGMLDGHGH